MKNSCVKKNFFHFHDMSVHDKRKLVNNGGVESSKEIKTVANV